MVEKLSKFVLYSYGIADLFFALMINMEAYFFTAFLTDYAQFSIALAGQILGLTSLIDIVCALAGGVLLQKVTLKYGGKYRSWFLVGPPLIAPLFILQFTKIGSNTTAALLVMLGFIAGHLLLNVVVYGEWKTGKNIRAFTMALMNLPIKIGVLIRSAVVTAGLMAIGFVANTPPSPRVIEGISSIMTLAPAAAYSIAAVIFFFGYKIDDSHILKMQEEIAARKTC